MKNGCTLFILALVVVQLACGKPAEEWQLRGWTQTPPLPKPTQTERVVQITTTPVFTYTPVVKIVTGTPENTVFLCVSADEAVYLRASPDTEFHPIDPLPNGTKVTDTKTRSGNWAFVQLGEDAGWINLNYLKKC